MTLSGCVTVNPGPDYQRTSHLAGDRVGGVEVYDPALDQLVEFKIHDLLQNGLTVEEAVRVALLNNRSFQALFYDIGASRADVVQSKLFTNPSISLIDQFPEGGGRSKFTFGLAQPIADLWQIPVRRKVAEAQLEQTVLTVAQRAVELTTDAKTRCYRLLALRDAANLARENLELAEHTLQLTEQRRSTGEVGQLDVNLARAGVIEARVEVAAAERDASIAHASLAETLGLARHAEGWQLNGALSTEPSSPGDAIALLEFALSRRLDLRALEFQVDAAEQEVQRQIVRAFPDVAVGFELERPDRRALPGRHVLADTARASVRNGQLTAPDIETRGQRQLAKSQIIDAVLGPSITLTLPIWDQNQAQVAKARSVYEKRRKEYAAQLDVVASQVLASFAAVEGTEEILRTYRDELLPQARSNIDIARQAYSAGEQSIIVLIDAQKELNRVRAAYLGLLRDRAIALAELERGVGHTLPLPAVKESGQE